MFFFVGSLYAEETEPDTGPIFFLEPPSNILIDSVVGAVISCRAHGKPAPQMDWQRVDGTDIPHNTGTVVSYFCLSVL